MVYDLETTYEKKSSIREIQAAVDSFTQMKIGLAEYQHKNLELADGLKARAEELETKELQLRSTLTTLINFADALIVLDQAGCIRFLNPMAEEFLQVRADTVLGSIFMYEVFPGQTREIEINIPGNTPRVANMQVVNTEWEGDEAFLVALRDITGRKQMEKEIQWRAETLQNLHETALVLPSQNTMAELYEAIAIRVVNFLDCTGVWIFSGNDENKNLQGVWNHLLQPNVVGCEISKADGLIGRVMKQGQALLEHHCNAAQFPGMAVEDGGLNFNQCIATPLIWGNRTLGVMIVGRDLKERFDANDVALLEQFGSLAAALDQKRLLIEAEGFYRRAEKDARTKAVLLKEINHRVKNNLASIIGLLYAEKNYSPARKQAEFQNAINGVIGQIQGLGAVHDLLNASDWQPLRLNDLVDKVIQSALQILPRTQTITVDITPLSIHVTPAVATSLAMVVNECATNSIKYGLKDRRQGKIVVTIEKLDKDGQVQLTHHDNGPGYPAEVLHLERFNTGLYLLKNIVERDLGGHLTLLNDNGAMTRILFPLAPV